MQKSNFIAGLILLAFSGWMLAYAIPNHTGTGMGFGLEPEGLPKVISWMILVLAVLQTFSSARNLIQNKKEGIADKQFGVTSALGLFGLMIASVMGATVLLMKYFGFLPAGVLFMVAIQLITGQRNWIRIVLLAIGTPLFLKLAFWYGMGVMLPTGLFFQ